jgi:ABC-type Mn2+/Zn2+ transport system permease subunit
MFDILFIDFMQNALIAGLLVSLISGIIGSLIVVNRMVFLAGGIAHTSYGGIGIFWIAYIFWGFNICYTSFNINGIFKPKIQRTNRYFHRSHLGVWNGYRCYFD